MLSADDLVDLGQQLRAAGFKLASYQYFSAQQAVLHCAAAGITDRARLATLLGPIFCTNAVEQRRFGEIFTSWLRGRFPEPGAPAPDSAATFTPSLGRSRPHLRVIIASVGLVVACAAAWAWLQIQRPFVIDGTVLDGDSPVAGAELTLGIQKFSSDQDGHFRIVASAIELPGVLKISMPAFAPDEKRVGAAHDSLRRHLYLWPRAPDGESITFELTPATAERAGPAIGFPPETGNKSVNIEAPREIDLTLTLGTLHWWQRLVWLDVAFTSTPLLLYGAWLLWSRLRRPTLQRLSNRTPEVIKDVHLPGGVSAPTASLPLRRLAQELRRRRTIHSDELQVRPTIDASLRNFGVFTPVRGSRVEPDYIALVDVASQGDHRARLEDELLRQLLRSDVQIERYSFQGDPTLCTRVTSLGIVTSNTARSAARRVTEASVVPLDELQLRHPDHRVLVFSDGSQLFDAFDGTLTQAAETLLRWSMPTLLTSKPIEHWGEAEWVLERRGFTVLPINRAGLMALMSKSSGSPRESFASDLPSSNLHRFERTPRKLLERDSPSDADVEQLCSELQRAFGDLGFGWIAACAAYPEIHWGITLRLGAVLVPDAADQERLLPRMARLAWFREGFMPDWARKALLARIPATVEATTRAFLHQVLSSLSADATQEMPLRIALGAARQKLLRQRLARALRDHLDRRRTLRRSERLIQSAPPDSPLRDYVFLRFISGSSTGKLSLAAPGTLLKLLFRGGSPLLGFQPAMAAFLVLVATVSIGMVVKPLHDGTLEQRFAKSAITENGAVVSVYGRWIEGTGNDTTKSLDSGFLETSFDGRSIRRAKFELFDATEATLSPRGSYFAVTQDQRSRIVATLTGNVVAEVSGSCGIHSGCLAFSGDDSVAAWVQSASPRPVIVLQKLPDNASYSLAPDVIPGTPRAVALNDDGTRLAVATSNGIYEVDLATREPTLLSPNTTTGRLAYGYRGELLGFDSNDAPGISNLATGRQLISTSTLGRQFADYSSTSAKPLLAAIADRLEAELQVVDTSTGAPLEKFFAPPGKNFASVSLARDGSQLVAETLEGKLSWWRIPDGFPQAPRPGRSFALIITTDDSGGVPLQTPIRDGQAIADLLQRRFGFGVTRLEGNAATKANVLGVLRQFGNVLEPLDSLLIYVSGPAIGLSQPSGFNFSLSFQRGSSDFESLSGDDLVGELSGLKAGSVLTIVDISNSRIAELRQSTPRNVTSGPVKEIITTGSSDLRLPSSVDGHSPFARAIIGSLNSAEGSLSARVLNEQVNDRLQRSGAGDQSSRYARLSSTDTDGRDYAFPLPLTSGTSAVATDPAPSPPPVDADRTNVDVAGNSGDNASGSDATTDQAAGTASGNAGPVRTLDDDLTLSAASELDFDSQRTGSSRVRKTFSVRNNGPYRWDITTSVSGESARMFQVSGCEILEPESSCELTVYLDPDRAGEHRATLQLSGSTERPQGTLSARINAIALRATVLDPPWRLEIRTVGQPFRVARQGSDVPEVVIDAVAGRPGKASVEVRNPRAVPVMIEVRAIEKKSPSGPTTTIDQNSCPRVLEPGQLCRIDLSYLFPGDFAQQNAPADLTTPDEIVFLEAGDGQSEVRARIIVRAGALRPSPVDSLRVQ